MRYIVITTARNEEKTIEAVIKSVQKQSIKPELHVIADDNSTDDTVIRSENCGAKVYPTNNPRIPYKGHNQVLVFINAIKFATKIVPNWDFVLKLDADSIIPQYYMKIIFKKFKENPTLGMTAGIPYNLSSRHSRVTDGARVISRKCYEAIGGYHVRMAFDSHAVLLANQYGFETVIIDNLKYIELRPAKKYRLQAWMLLGMERKIMYLPLYHTFIASLKNGLTGSPFIVNFFATFFSYLLYNPPYYDPLLNREWVKKYAIYELTKKIQKYIE